MTLGIQQGIEVRMGFIQQLLGPEAVKAQKPVGLIQPVFPQQGRFGIQRREQGVLHYRDISGVEHAFETILLIQRLRQVQDVPVRVPGGSHDELGALTRRGKDRSVLVLYASSALLWAAWSRISAMGRKNGLLALIRGQRLQPLLGGQLDIHAEPIRQEAQLLHQLRAMCRGWPLAWIYPLNRYSCRSSRRHSIICSRLCSPGCEAHQRRGTAPQYNCAGKIQWSVPPAPGA